MSLSKQTNSSSVESFGKICISALAISDFNEIIDIIDAVNSKQYPLAAIETQRKDSLVFCKHSSHSRFRRFLMNAGRVQCSMLQKNNVSL